MRLSARALNRATLARQMLLRRESVDVAEAVRRVVAVQAQAPASVYLALWNRLRDLAASAVDDALAEGVVVRGNALRMTLHALHTDDYRTFREATEVSLRAAKLGARFTVTGLTVADADAVVPELLAFAERPRTAQECEAWLAEWLGASPDERLDPAPGQGPWWGLRQYTPWLRAVTGGPWSFDDRPAYVAPRSTPLLAHPQTSDESLQRLAVRYLQGFGPASVADLAQFAMVQRGRARKALQSRQDELEQVEGADGTVLYDVAGAARPEEDTPAPARLMAMWDNVLLAYDDRSRVIPPEYRKIVTRVNGDVLPTLLVDGYVAGVWRPVDGGIEATAFRRLGDEAWGQLADEACALPAFLADREPRVYSRYGHWWAKLPRAAEVRLLPG